MERREHRKKGGGKEGHKLIRKEKRRQLGSCCAYLRFVSLRSIRYEPSREIPANKPLDLQ